MPQAIIQHGTLWWRFLIFVLPLIATNILQNLSGTINTIFVGQMIGVDAVAAVAVFFPILFCLLAFIIGLSAGCTVLVGQAWGAKDFEKLYQVVGTTLFLTLIGGTMVAALGIFFAEHLLILLETDSHILPLSLAYVRWMLAGSPILFVYLIYTSILRGVGDSITPLLALGLTSLIGLIVTPTLIKGYLGLPQLGIIAPAVATYIGYSSVLIFLYFYLKSKHHALQINSTLLKNVRYQPNMIKLILKLGVPTGIQMITTALAGLVIMGMVNRFGSHATAAYGAVNQVLNYVQFPALSIGIAASIFAAQAIGSGQIHLVKQVTHTAQIMNLCLTGTLVSLAYLGASHLMALFITDAQVVELGRELLFIVLWSMLCFGASAVFSSVMRASGTVIAPMLINVLAIVCIEIPLAYYFSHQFGLKGIWFGYAIAFSSMLFLQAGYYYLIWKKKSIRKLI